METIRTIPDSEVGPESERLISYQAARKKILIYWLVFLPLLLAGISPIISYSKESGGYYRILTLIAGLLPGFFVIGWSYLIDSKETKPIQNNIFRSLLFVLQSYLFFLSILLIFTQSGLMRKGALNSVLIQFWVILPNSLLALFCIYYLLIFRIANNNLTTLIIYKVQQLIAILSRTNQNFVLLIDIRKRFLWTWLGFSLIIITLVFIQTITGKYTAIESITWTWVFIQMLPGLILMVVLFNKNSSKVLIRASYLLAYVGSLAYLLLVLLTLFALPVAINNWSIEEYFTKSYYWLGPFQIMILLVLTLMFLRKQSLIIPNMALMTQYLAKKSEFAQRYGKENQIRALELLTSGGIRPTLVLLGSIAKPDEATNVMILQSHYSRWEEQRDLNLLSPDQLQRDVNRLMLAIIEQIEEI